MPKPKDYRYLLFMSNSVTHYLLFNDFSVTLLNSKRFFKWKILYDSLKNCKGNLKMKYTYQQIKVFLDKITSFSIGTIII